MSASEGFKGNEQVTSAEGLSYLKATRNENLKKIPQEKKEKIESVMTTVEVMKQSYVQNIEGIDFKVDGNADGLNLLAEDALLKMKESDESSEFVKLFGYNVSSLRKAINENDKKVIVSKIKDMESLVIQFTSNYAFETVRNLEKENTEKEKIKDEPTEVVVEKLDESQENVDERLNKILARLESGLPKTIKPNTDSYSRMQIMRSLYYGKGPNGIEEGALLKTAIKQISNSLRYNVSKDTEFLIKNMKSINDLLAVYILAAYQENATDLKIDGKFGPKTYASLVEDMDGQIVDRKGKAIDKFIPIPKDKTRPKKKKSVERDDSWYSKESELSNEMSRVLSKHILDMTDEEFKNTKNVIMTRLNHYDGDIDHFVGNLSADLETKEKIINIIAQPPVNFQEEALINAISDSVSLPKEVKEVQEETFVNKLYNGVKTRMEKLDLNLELLAKVQASLKEDVYRKGKGELKEIKENMEDIYVNFLDKPDIFRKVFEDDISREKAIYVLNQADNSFQVEAMKKLIEMDLPIKIENVKEQ